MQEENQDQKLKLFKTRSYLWSWVTLLVVSLAIMIAGYFYGLSIIDSQSSHNGYSFFGEKFAPDSSQPFFMSNDAYLGIDVFGGSTALLFVFLPPIIFIALCIFLVFRRWKIRGFWHKLLFIFANLFVSSAYLFIYIIIFINIVPMLMSLSIAYNLEPTFNEIKNNIDRYSVITNQNDIQNFLRENQEKVHVTNIDLVAFLPSAKKQNLTFKESYIEPRVVYNFFENFRLESDFVEQPYYIVLPKTLVVNDISRTIKDIGPQLSLNLIRSISGESFSGKSELIDLRFVDDDSFAKYFWDLTISNIKKNIRDNEQILEYNLKLIQEDSQIILNYEVEKSKVDISYQRTVETPKKIYQEGCVNKIKYSDCSKLLARINSNEEIERGNYAYLIQQKQLAEENIRLAKKYNLEIEKTIAADKGMLEDFINDQTNESKGRSSAGFFSYPSTIYFRSSSPTTTDFYHIKTLVHEFFHYYTTSGELNTLEEFINEGLTDYYALLSLGYQPHQMPYGAGYVLEVQIVSLLLTKIPEGEMIELYYSQQQKKFKEVFTKYFPDASYDDFMALGKKINDSTWQTDWLDVTQVPEEIVEMMQILKL